MEIKEIKEKIEKATIALATVNGEGKPYCIAVTYAKVKDGKLIITDNYMETTVGNIKKTLMSLPHLKRCGLLSFLDAQKAHQHTKVCGFCKLSDIKNNSDFSLVFWGGEKGWRIEGKAGYSDSGEWPDFVKSLKENKEEPAKWAVAINVEEIKELA